MVQKQRRRFKIAASLLLGVGILVAVGIILLRGGGETISPAIPLEEVIIRGVDVQLVSVSEGSAVETPRVPLGNYIEQETDLKGLQPTHNFYGGLSKGRKEAFLLKAYCANSKYCLVPGVPLSRDLCPPYVDVRLYIDGGVSICSRSVFKVVGEDSPECGLYQDEPTPRICIGEIEPQYKRRSFLQWIRQSPQDLVAAKGELIMDFGAEQPLERLNWYLKYIST